MHPRSSLATLLWISCSGLLLASCGDFQDPASGSQGTPVSHPSGVMVPQQEIGGTGNQHSSEALGDVVDPASRPITSDMAPASTVSTGTGLQGDAVASESAAGLFSSPPQSGTAQSSTGEGATDLPWLSRNEPQSGPVAEENRPQKKIVTFSWDPSVIGNVDGYRAYVTTLSTLAHMTIDIGLVSKFAVDLPTGERYEVTVTAYNDGGESPPASPIQFDLF